MPGCLRSLSRSVLSVNALVSVLADADAVQMLTRSTQCGEFYIMSPPTTTGANGDGWRPHMCDMIIYDEEADKHVRISWEEALAATMVDKDGKVGGVGNAANMAGVQGKTTANWVDLAFHWAQWNSAPAATALKKVSDGTASAVTTDTDKKTQHAVLSQLDIPYIIVPALQCLAPPRPLSVSSALPAARALSHPRVVACHRGSRAPDALPSSPSRAATPARRSSARRTCNCRPTPKSRVRPIAIRTPAVRPLCSPAPDDAVRSHRGPLYGALQSGHHQVRRSRLVPSAFPLAKHASLRLTQAAERLRDARHRLRRLCCGRELPLLGRGDKTNLFGAATYTTAIGNKQVGTYSRTAVRGEIQDRLAFVNSVGAKYASMLAFPMFEAQMDSAVSSLDTVMSVTSRLLPWEVNGTGSQGPAQLLPGRPRRLEAVQGGAPAAHRALWRGPSRRECAATSQPPRLTATHTHRKDVPTPSVLRVLPFFVARRPGLHLAGLNTTLGTTARLFRFGSFRPFRVPRFLWFPSACAQGSTNNALCFLGPHRKFDGFSNSFYSLTCAPAPCICPSAPTFHLFFLAQHLSSARLVVLGRPGQGQNAHRELEPPTPHATRPILSLCPSPTPLLCP